MNKVAIPYIVVFGVLGALLIITSIQQTFLFGVIVVVTVVAGIIALIGGVVYVAFTSRKDKG